MQKTAFSNVPAGGLFKRTSGDPGATLYRLEGNVMLNGNPMNSVKFGYAGVLYNIPSTEEVIYYPNARISWVEGGSVDNIWS